MPKITLEIGESFQENLLLQLLKIKPKRQEKYTKKKGV